ncbi:MAG: hypothetical protein ACLVFN_14210 [Enterocloster sp.]
MKLRFIKDEMGADRQAALQKQKKGQRYCIRAIGAVCNRAFCLGRTLGSLERAERGMSVIYSICYEMEACGKENICELKYR